MPGNGIKTYRGLVHKQYARPVQQGPGQFHLAFIAAAETAHRIIRPVGQFQSLQFLPDSLRRNRSGDPMQPGMQFQVCRDRQVQVQGRLLEHDADACQRLYGRHADIMSGNGN